MSASAELVPCLVKKMSFVKRVMPVLVSCLLAIWLPCVPSLKCWTECDEKYETRETEGLKEVAKAHLASQRECALRRRANRVQRTHRRPCDAATRDVARAMPRVFGRHANLDRRAHIAWRRPMRC